MPQMRVTNIAGRLDPVHAMARVTVIRNDIARNWLGKARPAGSTVELGARIKEVGPAIAAPVEAGLEQAAHFTAEWPFRALEAGYKESLRLKKGPPLLFSLLNTPGWLQIPVVRLLDNLIPIHWYLPPISRAHFLPALQSEVSLAASIYASRRGILDT